MEYFWLDQDKRIPNNVFIRYFDTLLGRRNVLDGNFSKLDDVNVVFAVDDEYNWFPDVLNKQLFLISRPVKNVFDLYLGDFPYKAICLLDNPNDTYCYYYVPILKFADCLSPSSTGSPDKSSFKQVVLKKSEIPNQPIFFVDKLKMQMLIVNREVAESLLRRKLKGISLRRIVVE